MDTPEERTAREIFHAVLRAAGLAFNEADTDRLAGEFHQYLDDGRRMTASLPPPVEPLPVVRVEE